MKKLIAVFAVLLSLTASAQQVNIKNSLTCTVTGHFDLYDSGGNWIDYSANITIPGVGCVGCNAVAYPTINNVPWVTYTSGVPAGSFIGGFRCSGSPCSWGAGICCGYPSPNSTLNCPACGGAPSTETFTSSPTLVAVSFHY